MGVVAKLRYVAYRKASGYHGRAPGFVYVHSGTARRESMRIHHPYGDASEDANGAAKRQMSWFFERKDTTRQDQIWRMQSHQPSNLLGSFMMGVCVMR
jgi:hypothetical protein